jgi:hypothetical protein
MAKRISSSASAERASSEAEAPASRVCIPLTNMDVFQRIGISIPFDVVSAFCSKSS